MPISRDTRTDRRRRLIRETTTTEPTPPTVRSNVQRRGEAELGELTAKRSAGYSQDVRRACGQRLVQLIPIRRRSYFAVVGASIFIPALLMLGHYLIYVSGQLPWYGHPMALALNANQPQSIVSWLSSHMWLLCLGATVLTFQLRRHKLDDYNGEYRLWFWLVLTCLVASIDATTHITEMFGMALDRWSQINLGWSGTAVVQATLTVMIGMLGLRLCTELKSVPGSLVFWLIGLVAWAGSAALAQEELQLQMSMQFRIWLKCSLWMGGLTAVWLASVTYLRSVYIDAQRRFLARGRLSNRQPGIPIGQRIRESLPNVPQMPSISGLRRKSVDSDASTDVSNAAVNSGRWWKLPRLRKPRLNSGAEGDVQQASQKTRSRTLPSTSASEIVPSDSAPSQTRQPHPTASTRATRPQGSTLAQEDVNASQQQRGLKSFFRRKSADSADEQTTQSERKSSPNSSQEGVQESHRKRSLTSWLRKPKHSDDAEEFRKVDEKAQKREENKELARMERDEKRQARKLAKAAAAEAKREAAAERRQARVDAKADGESGPSWLSKLARPKLPKFKLPKVSLGSLRLSPPDDEANQEDQSSAQTRPRTLPNRPLPSTSNQEDDYDSEQEDGGRQLSKAERKRLRRQGRAA